MAETNERTVFGTVVSSALNVNQAPEDRPTQVTVLIDGAETPCPAVGTFFTGERVTLLVRDPLLPLITGLLHATTEIPEA